MEAARTVIAIGLGVTTCSVGDIVAYAGFPVCAYAEEIIIPAERAVPVPPSVDPIVAALCSLRDLLLSFWFTVALRLDLGIPSLSMQPQAALDLCCANGEMHLEPQLSGRFQHKHKQCKQKKIDVIMSSSTKKRTLLIVLRNLPQEKELT
uniref:Quinone oxidoreductase n=1 Tax=Tanacetum cinerariifolium TaxID=118510 RepID=A0A699HET6_TANCI|nr:quinone oxidoreductase [Tanacetum cinerariifolium]GEZ30562.1 quinone oxidoreductase [Tanacetum cinerariifolium]